MSQEMDNWRKLFIYFVKYVGKYLFPDLVMLCSLFDYIIYEAQIFFHTKTAHIQVSKIPLTVCNFIYNL